MKILLTGANGYIGKQLLLRLIQEGHQVICCVRDSQRFHIPNSLKEKIEIIEVDFLLPESTLHIPKQIDIAFYLLHSMSTSSAFKELEKKCAQNFKNAIQETTTQQVIFLSGISNETKLSEHLDSRKYVEQILSSNTYNLTILRAGIIIGSGSASFEIIRDLVEKLPFMIAPKWLHTKCQPIAISDVLTILTKSIGNTQTFSQIFDIGGPTILSYKEMLLEYARVRNMKRYIYVVPFMTPKLSSYWLYFITTTSFKLASALVQSMKIEVICRNNDILTILNISPINYEQALQNAFSIIENNQIISSWKDSFMSSNSNYKISDFIEVPKHGCYIDSRIYSIQDTESCIKNLWEIGGNRGWFYANYLWKLRGFIDKLFGGVGLRRGRTHSKEIHTGDAIDFWRVLYANKDEGRLLLFAEMKLPGDAWLNFQVNEHSIEQTATFRPKGLGGILYWHTLLPIHKIIFYGMIKRIAHSTKTK